MSGAREELLRFIELQRADYRRGLPDKVARLYELLQRLRQDADPADALSEAERLAHGLHGTAGTFGFKALADAGQELELAVQALRAGGTALDAATLATVAAAIAQVESSLPP